MALIDAWLDMLTSASRNDLLVAAAMAGILELPLSGLCFLLALRAVTDNFRTSLPPS